MCRAQTRIWIKDKLTFVLPMSVADWNNRGNLNRKLLFGDVNNAICFLDPI